VWHTATRRYKRLKRLQHQQRDKQPATTIGILQVRNKENSHKPKQKMYHRITSKICNLEKDKAILAAHPDFDIRDGLRTSEALITSKLTHLEKVRANSQWDTLKAMERNQEEYGPNLEK